MASNSNHRGTSSGIQIGSAWFQRKMNLRPQHRGVHLVTEEILRQMPELNQFSVGLCHVQSKFKLFSKLLIVITYSCCPVFIHSFISKVIAITNSKIYVRHRHTLEERKKRTLKWINEPFNWPSFYAFLDTALLKQVHTRHRLNKKCPSTVVLLINDVPFFRHIIDRIFRYWLMMFYVVCWGDERSCCCCAEKRKSDKKTRLIDSMCSLTIYLMKWRMKKQWNFVFGLKMRRK